MSKTEKQKMPAGGIEPGQTVTGNPARPHPPRP